MVIRQLHLLGPAGRAGSVPAAPLTVVYRTGRRQDFQVSRGAVKPIAGHVLQQLAINSGHPDVAPAAGVQLGHL